MKERPILFSGPMVRAILSGRKTQTRRVVKWTKSLSDGRGFDCVQNLRSGGWVPLIGGQLQWSPYGGAPYVPYPKVHECCPFGEPGDWMWVREEHAIVAAPRLTTGAEEVVVQVQFCDGERRCTSLTAAELQKLRARRAWSLGDQTRARFMYRSLSRISLEIVSVRVERLQDISEADAIAEGIEPVQMPTGEVMYDDYLEPGAIVARPVSSYATLWDRINGAGAWSTNPWVWVVEFKKL